MIEVDLNKIENQVIKEDNGLKFWITKICKLSNNGECQIFLFIFWYDVETNEEV